MPPVTAGNAQRLTRSYWFTGFDFNATPGSRVAITGTIKNGYAFCIDPEAYTDVATLPSGMSLQGIGDSKYIRNVTQPKTGILSLFAGVAVNLPPEGIVAADYAGGYWIELAYCGEVVPVLTEPSATLVYGDGGSYLAPKTASWALDVVAVGTNGANIPHYVARPLLTVTNAATAPGTIRPCTLGPRIAWCG